MTMKINSAYLKNIRSMWMLLLCLAAMNLSAQLVPFAPRISNAVGAPHTGQQSYNLKGDFQMIGNSNLGAAGDPNGTSTTGANDTNMVYFNVDNHPGIVNSSSATLAFPAVAGVDHNCTEIIYAGLYWSGRADTSGTAPEQFDVVKGATPDVNTNVTNNNSNNGYTVTITSADDTSSNTSGNNRRIATYTFTPQGAGDVVVFRFYSWRTTNNNNSYTQKVTVQVGGGPVVDVPGTNASNSDDDFRVNFNTPYPLPQGAGIVQSLRKRRTNNSINGNFYATVQTPGNPGVTVSLDKRAVKIRHAGATAYEDVTSDGIYYPANSAGYMFSGYSDVTNYVKQHGLGEYFVGNIALREGTSDGTGYYGSWGMVVVYGNSNMTQRSITVFDGHAYMASNGPNQTLDVTGFKSTASGAVRATIGMMAGEGDRAYTGDTFGIRQGPTGSTYLYLNHSGQTSTSSTGYNNFFNSSVTISGNPARNPNNTNNYGSDIHMFDLVNTNNTIIGNNQNSTSFRFTSTQDTYIIYSIVFAVDSYIPEPTLTMSGVDTGNGILQNGDTVVPGQQYTLKFDLANQGNEAVENVVLRVPVPYNQHFVPGSFVTTWDAAVLGPQTTVPAWVGPNPGDDPNLVPGGYLEWNIGDLPLMPLAQRHQVLASMRATFRITTDCRILTTSACALSSTGGNVSGQGVESDLPVVRPSIRAFVGTCSTPVFEEVTFSLNVDASALSCPADIGTIGGQGVSIYHSTGLTVPYANIASLYPVGTVFYSVAPTAAGFNETTHLVSGPFAAPLQNNQNIRYYGVAPNMSPSCYFIVEVRRAICYEPAVTGAGIDTQMGITLLKRGGAENGNWPMSREGGFMALESNSKGLVITRMSTAQINAISNPAEGMMVYNTTLNCLMLHDGTAWKCFNIPTCP